MSVTACLITYKRPGNIAKIVSSLEKWPFISEIMIRDNERFPEGNLMCYARYRLAERASNPIIVTQDDDCIIENLDEIYERYIVSPDCVTFGLREEHFKIWREEFVYNGRYMLAMAGWGMFIRRDWLYGTDPGDSIFDSYWQRHGKDEFFQREADRIFSLLLRRMHNPVLAKLTHLPSAESPDAMWRQDQHIKSRDEAVRRCLEIIRGESA